VLLASLGWALLPSLPEAARPLMAIGGLVQLAAGLAFAFLAAELLIPSR
jgi:hypothetical protein